MAAVSLSQMATTEVVEEAEEAEAIDLEAEEAEAEEEEVIIDRWTIDRRVMVALVCSISGTGLLRMRTKCHDGWVLSFLGAFFMGDGRSKESGWLALKGNHRYLAH